MFLPFPVPLVLGCRSPLPGVLPIIRGQRGPPHEKNTGACTAEGFPPRDRKMRRQQRIQATVNWQTLAGKVKRTSDLAHDERGCVQEVIDYGGVHGGQFFLG